MQKSLCTGVILAGGENKRFNGSPKAFMRINGQSIVAYIMQAFNGLFEDIMVVTHSPLPYLDWDVCIVKDLHSMRSSLTGIHAGLFYAQTPYAFITACDTPFLHPALIERILHTIHSKYDVIIPQTAAGLEPLCAVYSKRCLDLIQRLMSQNRLKIQSFFNKVSVKIITEKMIREIDPELLSFFNINTPDDLQNASNLLKKQSNRRQL